MQHPVAALSSKIAIAADSMSDTTVAAPPPWEAERRPRPTWGLDEGDELAPGRTVLRRIGGGRRYEAMLVWDEHRLAVLVAKVLRPDQAREAAALRDLAHEAALLQRLAHPVVVRSFGAVPDGKFPHLVLEHLDGPTLDELLARDGPLALEQLLPLALHVASALHYLAAEGVVHLDVKPSNIVMGGPPRLIDLSVARTLEEAAKLRSPIGTDGYMAPEQRAPDGRLGPPADVFGLRGHAVHRADRGRRAARIVAPPAAPHAARAVGVLRAGLDPDPASRPAAAELAERARTAGRRPAAADDARPPLVISSHPHDPAATALAAGTLLGVLVLVALHAWRGIEYWNYSEGVYALHVAAASSTAATSTATSSSRSRRGSSSSARPRWRSTTR